MVKLKIIEREHYLSKLKNVIGTPDIKVITGVRRSGKSKLLEVFKKYIEDNIDNYNVIHITGKNCQTQIHKPNYYSCKFTNQIEHFFALADIVVSRAGSNSIFELLCIKKPMILIPLPKKASRGDQIDNAKYFEKHGYAKVIWQEDLNKNNFFKTINSMNLENISQKLSSSNLTNGNENIVKQILKYTNKK